MSKEMEQLVKEINELAHKSKTAGLTEEEKNRQKALRAKYLENFRANFRQQLDSIKVVDPNGNDITPKKRKNRHIN